MKLDKFYYMENRESGRTMVLCTEGDGLVGVAYFAKSEEENERMLSEIANGRSIGARVPGHSIFIMPANTISGRRMETSEAVATLREMALFFLKDRIPYNPGRYRNNRDGHANWSKEQAPLEVERLIEKYNNQL